MQKKEHSVSVRYVLKFLATLLAGCVNFIILLWVPRILGPSDYGVFSYSTNFFTQIVGFIESASSIAFFTKLSSENNNVRLIGFYQVVVLATVLLLVALICISEMFSFHQALLPHIEMDYVWLGASYAFLIWLNQVAIKISDAHALTVYGGIIRAVLSGATLFSFFIIISFHWLNLTVYFWFQNLTLFAVFLAFIIMLWIKNVLTIELFDWRNVPWGLYIKDFFFYCKPLYSYNIICIFSMAFDFWLLQHFSGLIQQGYYGFAFQIAAMCFFLTSTMIPIFMREVSRAYTQEDWGRLGAFFKHYTVLFFILTSCFSVFLMVNAREVAFIVGGEKYIPAVWVIALAMLYPVHQTLGQINGSMFYAMRRTEAYRNISFFTMVPGLGLSWALLASTSSFGLHLGALGLVLKMLFLQVIGVNMQLVMLAKWLNQSFREYIAVQILGLVAITVFSGMIHMLCTYIFGDTSPLVKLIIEGLLYGFSLLVIALFFSYKRKFKIFLD